jgi:hypothetical protein
MATKVPILLLIIHQPLFIIPRRNWRTVVSGIWRWRLIHPSTRYSSNFPEQCLVIFLSTLMALWADSTRHNSNFREQCLVIFLGTLMALLASSTRHGSNFPHQGLVIICCTLQRIHEPSSPEQLTNLASSVLPEHIDAYVRTT